MMYICSSCFGNTEEKEELNPESKIEVLEKMDEMIQIVNLRMKKLENEKLLKELTAQKFATSNELERARSELRLRHRIVKTHSKWNAIYENLNQIYHDMEQVESMSDVIDRYRDANLILKLATKKLDENKIIDVMDNLAEHSNIIQSTNHLLSENYFEDDDFEEEKAFEEICLPSIIPKKTKKQQLVLE